MIKPKIWTGCYNDNWRGLIVPEAFSHPAKFAPGLIKRIFDHGFEQGYWKTGDTIGDPFGGIGAGGIFAAPMSLKWIGVELEKKFVDLANQNIELHRHAWETMGYFMPVILQGDSRNFAEIVGGCDAICTSPPYAETVKNTGDGIDWDKATRGGHRPGMPRYDSTAGVADGYSTNPSNIGNLRAGEIDAVVTSPPYAASMKGSEVDPDEVALRKTKNSSVGGSWLTPGRKRAYATMMAGYAPENKENIGNKSGETYWQAMAQVYSECHKALKPNGVIVVIIKDYVKGGKRVPLCDQTWGLLLKVGFKPLERIRAMLVSEIRENGLFGEIVKVKSRKSFFRRLAEKNGSPRIDYEEVLWLRK